MSGYTPVFDTIYRGTLCGQWPAAAVWASILPLCDKNGHIDYTLTAIAGLTGWPMDLLEQGINALCAPDPHSRSAADDGRRLKLIDPTRPWGWQVVNHTKYREKARLAGRDAARVASGENKKRMRTRGASLQPGTALSDTGHQYARDQGLTAAEVSSEWASFSDYHHARGTVFRDWNAAWRTWCRNAVKFKKERGNGKGGSVSAVERVRQATGGSRDPR